MNVYVHNPGLVRVVRRGRFSVYVYAEVGQPHHLPHCYVRWSDGSTQVALPTLRVLAGDDLPSQARQLLRENLEEIYAAWNLLNPERSVR
jgi:hypothetical protein